jgi:hypothetical protein
LKGPYKESEEICRCRGGGTRPHQFLGLVRHHAGFSGKEPDQPAIGAVKPLPALRIIARFEPVPQARPVSSTGACSGFIGAALSRVKRVIAEKLSKQFFCGRFSWRDRLTPL